MNIITDLKKEQKIDYKTNLESDYIQANINAYEQLTKKEYKKAKDFYEETVTLSKQLNDEYKYTDSLLNLSIAQFFCGKISKAIDTLESALRSIEQIQNSKLYIKILSNLCLANLALCKKDSINYAVNIIDFIRKEKDITVQSDLLRTTLNCFFRLDSLAEFFEFSDSYENKIYVSDDKDSKNVMKRIIYYFHKFLRDSDYDSWIKVLSEEKENFKQIQDYNGFLFATFNQYTALYSKQPDKLREAKTKITSVKKILTGATDTDKTPEKILQEMKDRIDYSLQIYKKLWAFENELGSRKVTEDQDQSQRIFITIFLRYSLNYLKDEIDNNSNQTQLKYFTQMKNQIEITLKLAETNELDLSAVKLVNLDPEITEALKRLFDNLLYIRYKTTVVRAFKKLMSKTLGYMNRKEMRELKEQAFEIFMEKKFKTICEGSYY